MNEESEEKGGKLEISEIAVFVGSDSIESDG
jgi:hypothetical protein